MKTSSTLAAGCAGQSGQTATSRVQQVKGGRLTPGPGTRLVIGNSPELGERESPRPRHGSLLLKVGFVPDNDDGDVLVVLDADNLLPQSRQLGQRGRTGDAKDEEESLARLHV